MPTGSTVYGGPRVNTTPWNSFLLTYALCFFIMFFPFLVCDLYYAYHGPANCIHPDPSPIVNLQMSLNQWLQIDGYIILGFIVFFLILGILACCTPQLACIYGWWEGLHVLFILWRLSWLIVGSVLFWGGLNKYGPNYPCAGAVAKYMWANLIIGYIWLFVELALAFAYPRPIPYPVAIPAATALGTTTIMNPVTATPIFRPGGIVY